MTHVFISYVRENSCDVQKLCDDLTERGINVWLDRSSIQPGVRWKNAIRNAIKQGDFFIACFSKEYHERSKTYMNEELTIAIDELRQFPINRSWFIPVLLSECNIPARNIGGGETLLDFQWVSLHDDWANGVERIVEIVNPLPKDIRNYIESLKSKDDVIRQSAVEGLGKLKLDDLRVISVLISALGDSNNIVRQKAIWALAELGENSLSYLLDFSEGELKILKLIRDEDNEVSKETFQSIRTWKNPLVIRPIIELIDEKDLVHFDEIVDTFIFIGEKAADEMIKTLNNGNWYIRALACDVLKAFPSKRNGSKLLSVLDDDNDTVLVKAISALERSKVKIDPKKLLDFSLRESLKVKRAAIRALGYSGEENVVPNLISFLDNPELVDVVVESLGNLKSIDAIPALSTLAEKLDYNDDETLVNNFIKCLGQIGSDKAVDILKYLLLETDDGKALYACYADIVEDALNEIGTEKAKELIKHFNESSLPEYWDEEIGIWGPGIVE